MTVRTPSFIVLTIVGTGCGLSVVASSTTDEGAEAVEEPTRDASVDTAAPVSVDADSGSQPSPVDAGTNDDEDAAADVDAGPLPPVFGEECPPGTVYEDDFTFDPTGRWFPVAATWTWDSANKIYTVTGFDPHGLTWIGERPKWQNYSIEASIRVSAPSSAHGNAGPVFRVLDVGEPPVENNDGHMYLAAVVLNGDHKVIFGIEDDGSWSQEADTKNVSIPSNQWITMRVDVTGKDVKVYVGDKKAIDTKNDRYTSGSIGFKTYRLNLSIRSVKVTCL